MEPQNKVSFNLTYEELLTRKLGLYDHVITLNPGQVGQWPAINYLVVGDIL